MEPQAPICIICLRDDGGASGREHVLQHGLNARFMLPPGIVCDRCNNATSCLDKALIDFIAIKSHQQPHKSILTRGVAICNLEGHWWRTIPNGKDWNRQLPPQLIVSADGTTKAWGSKPSEFQTMRAELQPGSQAEFVHTTEHQFKTELKGQPLVVRSGRNKYQILAADDQDRALAAQLLLSGHVARADWDLRPGLASSIRNTQTPVVEILLFPMEHAHRALFKVVLNFVAFALTPELARLSVFDVFRQAILEGSIEAKNVFESGIDRIRELAKDAEQLGFENEEPVFLALFGMTDKNLARAATRELIKPGTHSLAIGCSPGHLSALITIHGTPHANLRLPTPILKRTPIGIWACAIIDPQNKTPANDDVAIAPTEALVHIARHLQELSANHENARSTINSDFRQSKPQIIKATYSYAAEPTKRP